jgi:signal transduction histidine kinase
MDGFFLQKQIVAKLVDGITVQDRDFNIIYQNDMIKNAFGEHLGEKCYAVYECRDHICEGCGVAKVFATGKPVLVHRVAVLKDGSYGHWENSCFPLYDDAGEIIAGVEVCRDVSDRVSLESEVRERAVEMGRLNDQLDRERRKLEEAYSKLKDINDELKATQKQLIKSEKMAGIGQLAAGVAHEINNPTAYILNNISFLRKSMDTLFKDLKDIEELITRYIPQNDDNSEFHKELKKIIENKELQFIKEDFPDLISSTLDGAERIKKIVSNLRTFAHPGEEGKSSVNINEEIERALDLIYNEIKYHCEVIKDLKEVPLILGNSQQLDQVFMNILINASHAVEEKGVIHIATYEEDSRVVVEIADNGAGISEENISKLFNPFFTTKEVGKGTGLGLSIAYGIIEDHDGKIEVESKVGEGTKFIISLPLVNGDDHFNDKGNSNG